MSMDQPLTTTAEARLDDVLAHAWMVRTFVKHSPEAEAFPELMQVVRVIFDLIRAIESRRDEPSARLAMLKKKLPKLRRAADAFRVDAPVASDHENFRQAVRSLDACVGEFERLAAPFAEINHGIDQIPPT